MEKSRKRHDLSTVSASLGSIAGRTRSKNVVRTLERCGECGGANKVVVARQRGGGGGSGGAVVVGTEDDGFDQHLVVHSMDDGRRMRRIRLGGGSGSSDGGGGTSLMVGVSPMFEYVVTSHKEGYLTVWETWNLKSTKEDGIHSKFVLGLESGHTELARSVDFSYSKQGVRRRRPLSISVYASMVREDEEQEERGGSGRPTYMVTCGNDGQVIVWDLWRRCIFRRTSIGGGVAERVVFTAGGNSGSGGCDMRNESINLVCFVIGNVLHLWDLEKDEISTR
jgi:hypothetical protein